MPRSARPRRTQEERSALSDSRMLAAATTLIVEGGVPGLTLAAIAERAGYSRGLVSHRYGSKAGLLAQVHRSTASNWVQAVQKGIGNKTGLDAILSIIDVMQTFLTDAPDEISAMYMLRYSSIDPGVAYREAVARTHRAQRRDVGQMIRDGQASGQIRPAVEHELLAELYCCMLDGICYRWILRPDLSIDALCEEARALTRQWLAA
ncbi:MAG: TetR/AcrR family transcriptional regulator [Oceanococcaceae bacterium]